MPKFTALLRTHNDALRLGRALQSLRPCDEVLVNRSRVHWMGEMPPSQDGGAMIRGDLLSFHHP